MYGRGECLHHNPGFADPCYNFIPCLFALDIALAIINVFSFPNSFCTAVSDDGLDLVLGYLVLGGGSRNGREDEGFFREDFFLLLLGILVVVDLYNNK